VPLAAITHSITSAVGHHGLYAVFGLLLIDAVFPAASELVMVYGGALAAGAFGSSQQIALFGNRISSHTGAYIAVALAGTLGYLVGSWLGWAIGAVAGRPFVERHARLFHLDGDKLGRADAWFEQRGALAVFVGRLTPVVRSFVSIPAGFEQMRMVPYTASTIAGNTIWCFALAGAGWGLGTGYQHFHHLFDYASIAVVVAVLVAAALIVARRRLVRRAARTTNGSA
jgi:membrane protein DedA with SNARE-associated domain